MYEIRKVPVADGGDFTGEVLSRNLKAQKVKLQVTGPMGKKVEAIYFVTGKTAIIEMANASGMKLVKSEELNPLLASSVGTGELIVDAIKRGCTNIYLAIGGSATVDGGMGMMKALDFYFFDKNQIELKGVGTDLFNVSRIEKGKVPDSISITIICDVDNPLLGENGAAKVFGPQKGATPEMIHLLEEGLVNWAELLSKESVKELKHIKGLGAAGGLSLPLIAYFNAKMVQGANFVLDVLDFEKHVQWADLVITGEGKIDSQTANNKAPFAVAQLARKYGKPVLAIGGNVERNIPSVFDGVFSIVNGPCTIKYSMENADKLLYDFSCELAKTILAIRKI